MTFASPARFRACLISVLVVATIGRRSGTLYRRLLLTSAVAFVLLACSLTGVAQKDAGAIAGVARDASGAVIAGVSVTATDVDHGTAVTVSSNTSGEYVIGPLKVGRYVINAHRSGFTSVVSTPITLQVHQRVV
jgi:hypothetical protein